MKAEITIDPEFRDLIPPLAPEELAGLEDSLIREGCRDALVVWAGSMTRGGDILQPDESSYDGVCKDDNCKYGQNRGNGRRVPKSKWVMGDGRWECPNCHYGIAPLEYTPILLDGHHRFEICQRHGLVFKTKEIELADRDSAKDWIETNQLSRRNLPPQVMSVLRGNIFNRRKKKEHDGGKGKPRSGVQNEPNLRTAEIVAKETGVSPATIKRDAKLAAEVAENPKLKAALNDRAEFKQVRREQKEASREQRRADNRAKIATAPAPEKIAARFATILIDPPWDWGDEGDKDQLGRARPDYATMTLDQLLALPVPKLADDDCHLFCWITNRSLPKGFALLERWGFRYITALTWPKPHFGMGNYFRGQTEHILFGVKGSQPLKRKDASTLLPTWKRGKGGHSSKPLEVYEFIESVSPGPYLEMFSRSERKEWTTWGEGK